MIRTLFRIATILAPSFACAANPSANLSVQIVPPQSAPTPAVPTAAQNAGFTTLAANFDFSQPFYASQSNWLDCGNTGGPQTWHSGEPGIPSGLPCNVFQGADPVTGDTTMIFTYLQSYDGSGDGLAHNVSMQTTANNGGAGSLTFPNMYLEVVSRMDGIFSGGTFGSGVAEAVWTWATNSGPIEIDVWENSVCCGPNGISNGNADNWANKAPSGIRWANYSNNNLPAGYKITDYHKYGALLTSDGQTKTFVCLFVDDILQAPCADMLVNDAAHYLERNWLIMSMGNADTAHAGGHTYHMYNKSVRVYSCDRWQSAMCNGSTLFNSGGLTYWH
jgi:hypothetical protein